MTGTICHTRLCHKAASNSNGSCTNSNSSNSQRTHCDGSDPGDNAPQRTNAGNNNLSGRQTINARKAIPKKRGRAKRARTSLRMPPNGRKVQLEPNGETQFKHLGGIPNGYKYDHSWESFSNGSIHKYMDDSGVIRSHPTLEWEDYYLVHDDEGVSNVDRVKQEFWRCFEVAESNRVEVDRILESYVRRKVKDNLYQARVDAVKIYYDDQGEELDDTLACARELT
uniref:Uncharacterized protein n=1 Tax=Triticum urartu TaxID=4572 RepID=A0A8R7UJX8_TRIUA